MPRRNTEREPTPRADQDLNPGAQTSPAVGDVEAGTAGARSRVPWRWLMWLAIAGAAAVRVALVDAQFWLDEIWSLGLAQQLNSPLEVLTRLHIDNNHYLNTLWLYLCGFQRHWFVYRLHSLAAGIATVYLATRFCGRWGARAACFAALLTGFSYLLILYAVEARGYALAGCFTLAAFLALERYLAVRGVWMLLAFWGCVVFGSLSHLTFLQAYLALGVWSCLQVFRQPNNWWNGLRQLGLCHVVPCLVLAGLYVLDVSELRVGGGPEFDLFDVLRGAAAVAVGVVQGGPTGWFAALLATMTAGAGIYRLFWQDWRLAVFFAVAVVIAPALALALHPPVVLFVRYFYLNILFSLLLMAYVLDQLCYTQHVGGLIAGLAVMLFAGGNAQSIVAFHKAGRGDFAGILDYMVANTRESTVHIGGDHDFRNQRVIEFYAQRLSGERPVQYHTRDTWPAGGPEWLMITMANLAEIPKVTTSPEGRRYELVRLTTSGPLAGIGGAVYHGEPFGQK